jgi:hypothetical protein
MVHLFLPLEEQSKLRVHLQKRTLNTSEHQLKFFWGKNS